MPSAVILPEDHSNTTNHQSFVPEILRTPSGTILVEIQGTINVGTRPLITSDLDLQVKEDIEDLDSSGPPTSSTAQFQNAILRRLGRLDFSNCLKSNEVVLDIGKHQRLRGKISRLDPPLAVLHMNSTDNSRVSSSVPLHSSAVTIPVVEVIKHKLVFNVRPEPVVFT